VRAFFKLARVMDKLKIALPTRVRTPFSPLREKERGRERKRLRKRERERKREYLSFKGMTGAFGTF
jgi:hypothetical protein